MPARSAASKARARAYQKAYRARRVAAGLCSKCGQPTDRAPAGADCSRCIEAGRVARNERYERRMASGRCVQCNGRKLDVTGAKCEPCLEKARGRRKRGRCAACYKRIASGSRCAACRVSGLRAAKAKYRERRRKSLCVQCGKPVAKFAACLQCRTKTAARLRARRRKDG